MTTRRRALTILAGLAVLPMIGGQAGRAAQTGLDTRSWRGVALGAKARIILDHPDAETLLARALEEIRRLENIFSLYKRNSELSRLNREGFLLQPSLEMVELLSGCAALNLRTAGVFDPSVQALWSLYARAWSKGRPPDAGQIKAALAVTGWKYVKFSAGAVSFERKGVQLTLNGIAQGFIADKIAGFFRRNGVGDVLVNTGEIAALGLAPDGRAWRVNFDDNGAGVDLTNAAIATSAPLGTVFDEEGTIGHILDPRTGYSGGNWSKVTVICGSAAKADGLSTAFSLMSADDIEFARGDVRVLLS